MPSDSLVLVTVGDHCYAVEQRHVGGLHRVDEARPGVALATLLGDVATGSLPYALAIAGAERLILVQTADLRGQMTRLPLPSWVAAQAHAAVVGLTLDGTKLVPIVDPVQLALETGNIAP